MANYSVASQHKVIYTTVRHSKITAKITHKNFELYAHYSFSPIAFIRTDPHLCMSLKSSNSFEVCSLCKEDSLPKICNFEVDKLEAQ